MGFHAVEGRFDALLRPAGAAGLPCEYFTVTHPSLSSELISG
jgi:hypothetical protein